MKKVKITLNIILTAFLLATSLHAKEWHGIVPLHSTRMDVERILGKPNAKYDRYDLEDEQVAFIYSRKPCSEGLQGMWNIPFDTVISIRVFPKRDLLLSELNIEKSKFKKEADPFVRTHVSYTNSDEGIVYVVFDKGIKDSEKVLETYYEPAKNDYYLLCENGSESKPQVTPQTTDSCPFAKSKTLATRQQKRASRAAGSTVRQLHQ